MTRKSVSSILFAFLHYRPERFKYICLWIDVVQHNFSSDYHITVNQIEKMETILARSANRAHQAPYVPSADIALEMFPLYSLKHLPYLRSRAV